MSGTYRKYNAYLVVSNVLLGYELGQYKEKQKPSKKDWSGYVQAIGITVKRAGILIRMAKKLYRNPITDRKRLDEIAALRIPWGTLMGACSDSVTDEQRELFFEAIARRGHPETLSEDEAWSILKSIAHPIQQSELPLAMASEPGSENTRREAVQMLGEALRRALSPAECSILAQCLSAS